LLRIFFPLFLFYFIPRNGWSKLKKEKKRAEMLKEEKDSDSDEDSDSDQ
jgi:hypothetical protein